MTARIRRYVDEDLTSVAELHATAFPRQADSRSWIQCNGAAFPRTQLMVAELDSHLVGFIIWSQKSGFRQNVVAELEQLAVAPAKQRQGIGRLLIDQSLSMLRAHLAERGASLSRILVATGVDNPARRLYEQALGAKVEAQLLNFFTTDELLLVARFG